MQADLDERFRIAAFAYLRALGQRPDGLVRRHELESLPFEGRLIRLIGPQQGIWRPSFLQAAFSILTTYVRPGAVPPYQDEEGPDGYPRYKWRGTDPRQADNVSLRLAMEHQRPLAWFIGIQPGVYRARFPIWLVGEEPLEHQFVVALDATMREGWRPGIASVTAFDPVRRYAETVVRQRLHQRVFRDRVLLAYAHQCALCRLRLPSLLDAAHIKEDSEGGKPIVPNGLAMCTLHHRAFDADVLGVRPDFRVEIREDVREEQDGPTLRHALQGLHGEPISLPARRSERPDRELLEERYERFRVAS